MLKNKILKLSIFFMFTFFIFTACSNLNNEQINHSLTVCTVSEYDIPSEVISQFKQKYPNKTLNIITKDEDETQTSFYSKLSSELMTGVGADIILINQDLWSQLDGDKAMRNGLFEDLSKYFSKDISFNAELYNSIVWNAGNIDGKQYLVPFEFGASTLFTTDKMLNQTGFEIDNASTINELTNEVVKFYDNNDIAVINKSDLHKNILYKSGIQLVDYDNQQVTLDTVKIKPFVDFSKQIFVDCEDKHLKRITDGSILFEYFEEDQQLNSYSVMSKVAYALNQTPKTLWIKDVNGNIPFQVTKALAVNNSSKNKELAYNFIKIWLEEINDKANSNMSNSISNNCTQYTIEKMREGSSVSFNSASGEQVFENLSGLSDTDINIYKSFINSIKYCNLFKSKAFDVFYDEMLPYLKDEKSYEECIQSAQSKLEIYISE